MRQAFDRRRRLIVEKLSQVPGFTVPTPTGAFYAFPDVSDVLGRTIRGKQITTSTDLATVILEEADVAAVPGEAFGAPGHLRFSYALADADITEGTDRVIALLSERARAHECGRRRPAGSHHAAEGAPAPAFHGVDAPADAAGAGRGAGQPATPLPHRRRRAAGRADPSRMVPLPAPVRRGPRRGRLRTGHAPPPPRGRRGRCGRGLRAA